MRPVFHRALILIHKPVADEAVKGRESIPPGDFFPLFKSPSMVGNGNFIEPATALEDFRGYFGLKIEPVGPQTQAADDIPLKNLVACLHVR